jgi:hypothetical protein
VVFQNARLLDRDEALFDDQIQIGQEPLDLLFRVDDLDHDGQVFG